MRVMDTNELYDPEFRKLIQTADPDVNLPPTIIIPVGSLEQHGAHLPITTDSDIVTEIASRLGKKCNFMVLPTISYGVSDEHHPLTNITIGNSLESILEEIIWSLGKLSNSRYEEPRYEGLCIILNGHHGNMEVLSKVEKEFAASLGDLQDVSDPNLHRLLDPDDSPARETMGNVRVYSYWKFMKHEFDHAGFVETSIMWLFQTKSR